MIHNFSVYDCGTGQLRYYVEWDSGVREGTTVKLNKKRRNLSTFIQRSSIGEASPIGGTMSPGSYTKKPSLTVSIDAQITKPMNDLSVESPSVQSSNSNGGKNSFPSHLTFLQDHAIQEKAALVYGMWQSLQSITQKLTRA